MSAVGDPALPSFTDHVYAVKHGVDLSLRIFQAPRPSTATPYILWLHGGAYTSGQHYRPYAWWLASTQRDNITLISVGYRLAPRVGYSDMVDDCHDAWHFVRCLAQTHVLKVDVGNFVVAGTSAGGSLALSLAARLNPAPRAVVAMHAPTVFTDPSLYTPSPTVKPDISCLSGLYSLADLERASTDYDPRKAVIAAPGKHDQSEKELRTFWETSEVALDSQTRLQTDLMLFGGWGMSWLSMALQKSKYPGEEEWQVRQQTQSPTLCFSSKFPPTALVHGLADDLLPVKQTEAAVERLRALGVRTEAWYPPGKKHAFDRRIQMGSGNETR